MPGANHREFIDRQADERRAQDRQQRQVLHRIVEQLQQAEQVADFSGAVKIFALHVQRDAHAIEFARENLRLVPRRAQQHDHVAPFHRARNFFVVVPDLQLVGAQFFQLQRHQARFFLRRVEIDHVVVAECFAVFTGCPTPPSSLVLVRMWISTGGNRAGFAAEADARFGRAKNQVRVRVISHAADLFAHEQAEEGIDEIEHGFVAAEIVRERNCFARVLIFAPEFFVGLKNFRIGEAEAVDALLHIADEKAIRLRRLRG